MSGDRSTEGLAERNDRFAIDAPWVYKVVVGRFGITIDSGFARLSFAAPVASVFQGKYICVCAVEKFIGRRAVGDIGGVTVKSEERKFCLVGGDPPRVKLDTVRGGEPNIFNIQTAGMPVAFKAAGIVWEKDQVRFEHADEH